MANCDEYNPLDLAKLVQLFLTSEEQYASL
jgi:hypothetical protein